LFGNDEQTKEQKRNSKLANEMRTKEQVAMEMQSGRAEEEDF
jgi:hypothetical protein